MTGDDDAPGPVQEAAAFFGIARDVVTGEKAIVCKLIAPDGKEHFGYGETRKEALFEAFKAMKPTLKNVQVAPQLAWNPIWGEMNMTVEEEDAKLREGDQGSN